MTATKARARAGNTVKAAVMFATVRESQQLIAGDRRDSGRQPAGDPRRGTSAW